MNYKFLSSISRNAKAILDSNKASSSEETYFFGDKFSGEAPLIEIPFDILVEIVKENLDSSSDIYTRVSKDPQEIFNIDWDEVGGDFEGITYGPMKSFRRKDWDKAPERWGSDEDPDLNSLKKEIRKFVPAVFSLPAYQAYLKLCKELESVDILDMIQDVLEQGVREGGFVMNEGQKYPFDESNIDTLTKYLAKNLAKKGVHIKPSAVRNFFELGPYNHDKDCYSYGLISPEHLHVISLAPAYGLHPNDIKRKVKMPNYFTGDLIRKVFLGTNPPQTESEAINNIDNYSYES